MEKSRFQKAVASLLSITFAFMVFSFSFAPKAHAVEFTGGFTYGFADWVILANPSSNYIAGYTTSNGDLPLVNVSTNGIFAYNNHVYAEVFNTYPEQIFKSEVKLYASYWFPLGNNVGIGDYLNPASWVVSYINDFGNTGYVEGGVDVYEAFQKDNGGTGYRLEASWSGSDGAPIRALKVQRDGYIGFRPTGNVNNWNIYYPSIRIITTEMTAEMEQLDKVADAIIEQNSILLAMKGDIVAILQDIYTMTGDMYIAQNLLNSYIAEMLPLLESIDNTTTAIYSLLSTQLRLLETAIENAADSIEAAISAQTAAMIAYLESVLNTGNEIPDDTYQQQQDAENILDELESLEKPDVETIVPEIDDYTDGGVSGVLSAIFSSNLIVTMMTLSASLAFGAYVLFGKRG